MIRAYKIYTGSDGHTHIITGSVAENNLNEAISIRFKETPPYSSYDWHPAPTTQYVITLSGTLEFTTYLGETFILKPGDILIAMDTTGTGHKWRMVDDEPWKRVYVKFNEETEVNFIADEIA